MSTNPVYVPVRGLSRGLAILTTMNQLNEGRATAQQLSLMTGLHRTTVRRLLETLINEGFVRRSNSDDHYVLTLKVRSLSEGFTDDEWISEIANPLLSKLFQQVVWPSDLYTCEGADMIIRETTHRLSPLSFHRSVVGRRVPMLLTSPGRAYFCACRDSQKEEILSILRAGGGCSPQTALANDAAYIKNLIRQVNEDGYASNHGDWAEEHKIGGVSVALHKNGRVIGALNTIYTTSALTPEEAAKRFLPPIRQAAALIEKGLEIV